jgi:hypothetical protein
MQVTQEQAQKLKNIPGRVKGAVILADAEYVRLKGGESALKKIEQRLNKLGYQYSFQEIRPMDYYPEPLSVMVILLAKEVLELDDQGVFEMGKAVPKISFFLKILTKHFVSIRKCFEESPRYWKKHFDFGELEPVELNEAEKYGIIRVKGYKFHPIMCIYHKGYFSQIASLSLGKQVSVEETQCSFKKGPYHEYVIRWE